MIQAFLVLATQYPLQILVFKIKYTTDLSLSEDESSHIQHSMRNTFEKEKEPRPAPWPNEQSPLLSDGRSWLCN